MAARTKDIVETGLSRRMASLFLVTDTGLVGNPSDQSFGGLLAWTREEGEQVAKEIHKRQVTSRLEKHVPEQANDCHADEN